MFTHTEIVVMFWAEQRPNPFAPWKSFYAAPEPVENPNWNWARLRRWEAQEERRKQGLETLRLQEEAAAVNRAAQMAGAAYRPTPVQPTVDYHPVTREVCAEVCPDCGEPGWVGPDGICGRCRMKANAEVERRQRNREMSARAGQDWLAKTVQRMQDRKVLSS